MAEFCGAGTTLSFIEAVLRNPGAPPEVNRGGEVWTRAGPRSGRVPGSWEPNPK